MKAYLARQNYIVILALLALVVAISAPVYSYRILTPTDNDYGTHIQFALDLLQHKAIPSYTLAHPMLQALLIGLLWLSRGRIGLWTGSIAILAAAQALTALILYLWIGPLAGKGGDLRRAFWAAGLTIAAPVMALVLVDGRYYWGYIGLATYHNPTVHLLRPLALLSFVIAVRLFNGPRSPAWLAAVSALLILLSALIKPNYALVILPALGLLVFLRWLGKQPVDWRLALLGFAIPAVVVLAVQAWVTYGDGSAVILAPFVVERAYSSYLPIKFLLSILFPLVVLGAYFSQAWRNTEVRLAWAAFAAGALELYLLAESGDRLMHGNFRWSAQIGLFLLFAASARYILQCAPWEGFLSSKRRLLVSAAYLLHLGAGILYYLHTITSKGYG